MVDLTEVCKNRENLIKKALKNNGGKLDADVYACFFECKKKIVEEIIAKEKKGRKIIDKKQNLSEMRKIRAEEVDVWTDAKLEKYGLWHKPINDIKEPEELLVNLHSINYPINPMKALVDASKAYYEQHDDKTKNKLLKEANAYIPYLTEALVFLQLGASKAKLAERYGWKKSETSKAGKISTLVGLQKTPDKQLLSYPEVTEALSAIMEAENIAIRDVITTTGISTGTIVDIEKYGLKEVVGASACLADKKISERRKAVWEAYITEDDMRSMEDLAKLKDVKRATISADIRAMLADNLDKADYIRKKRYAVRKDKKDKVLTAYDNMDKKDLKYPAIVALISEKTKIDKDRVKSILKRYRGVEE